MAQNAFFVKKCHFSTCTISRRVASDRFSFNILGRGRPELKALLPMVGFCDMFFIQNQPIEVICYYCILLLNIFQTHSQGVVYNTILSVTSYIRSPGFLSKLL